MADINLAGLPAISTIENSDLLHVQRNGVDYKQTELNFLQQFQHEFTNDRLLTDQVDDLSGERGIYFGTIKAYNHVDETGVPQNAYYYVTAKIGPENYRSITIQHINNSHLIWVNTKSGGTWGGWVKMATNPEINNIGKFTYYANGVDVNTTTSLAYTGISFTLTKASIVRACLRYTYSPPAIIAIGHAASGNQTLYAHATATDGAGGVANSGLTCTAILWPGTYYVYAKSQSAATNKIFVEGMQIQP